MPIINISFWPVDRPTIARDPELLGGPHIPPAPDDGFLEKFFNRKDEGPPEMFAEELAEGRKFGEKFSAYMARERRWYLARTQAFKN